MNDTQEQSPLNWKTLTERLESIESLLFALYSNAHYMEYEPFEVPDDEDKETSGVKSVLLKQQLENYIDGLGLRYFKGRELTLFGLVAVVMLAILFRPKIFGKMLHPPWSF